ncbi:hypothetical protein RB195_001491 [Necator americanus]|uniref:Uncharacterized protein n=1 Tax=Necator americanus TaxID=51031 RepID=A0ABR1DFR0_NECAM
MKELLALARPVRRSTGVKVNKVTIHGMATDADLHVLLGPRERMKFNMIALRETKSRRSGVRQMNVGTLVIRREEADMSIDLQMAYIYTVINGHPYPPLYDCSNRTTEEWYATGSEEWPLGIYFLVTGVLLEVIAIFIQSFLICLINVLAAYIYVYMQYFAPPKWLVIIGQIAWQLSAGFVCVIYLTVNRTIRRGVIDLLVPKKYVGRVHAKLAPTTRASDNRTHSDAHLT